MADGNVALLVTETFRAVVILRGLNLGVRRIAFSLDGKSLVASSFEDFRIWRTGPEAPLR